jgi:hypothetical protein
VPSGWTSVFGVARDNKKEESGRYSKIYEMRTNTFSLSYNCIQCGYMTIDFAKDLSRNGFSTSKLSPSYINQKMAKNFRF